MNIQLNDNNSSKLLLENNKPILINNNSNILNTTNSANITSGLISNTLLPNNSNLIINGANNTSVSSNNNSAPTTGYYLIQSTAPSSHQNTSIMQIKAQQSNQMQQQHQTFQLITNQTQYQSPLQQQTHLLNQNNSTKYITTCASPVQTSTAYAFNPSNSSNLSSPRFIIHPSTNNTNLQNSNNNQLQQQPTVILQNTNQLQTNTISNSHTTNNTGQIFLNINNRIVPIQSVNLKNSPSSNSSISIQQHQPQEVQRLQLIASSNSVVTSAQYNQHNQPTTIYTTANASNETSNNSNNNVNTILSSNPLSSTITPANNPNNQQYLILSSNSNKNTPAKTIQPQNHNAASLSTEITEKMKQLELIQNQLKSFQIKLASFTKTDSSAYTKTFTQQQIQSVLTSSEQTELQKLIIQRKNVQTEIQQLQQKLLLAPSSINQISNTVTIPTSLITNNSSSNKLQLLQQVTAKINEIKSTKSVANPNNPTEQQLVLTQSEFDQMKKLLEFQSQLQNEINSLNNNNLQQQTSQQIHQQPQLQQQLPATTIKLSELNLADKQKLNELIKNQIQQLKQNLSNNKLLNQEASKEKLIALIKKQAEVQTLIDQSTTIVNQTNNLESSIPNINISNINNNKQTPLKIRNFISPNQNHTSNIEKSTSTNNTPLRTLIINSNTVNSNSNNINNLNKQNFQPISSHISNEKSTNVNQSQQTTQELVSIENAINLQKQNFPNVKFKCLNFLELAQHSIITKQTSDLTINLIKQLDERASKVINPDQVESFSKNQVKLVKKYLEQQHNFKQTIKNRIQDQLSKDHRFVLEPDFKTPFVDKTDAIKRLSRYHVFQKTNFEPSEEESEKFDECFEQVSERLLKTADAMKKRFHLFKLRSMQKEVVSSEETMMLKLFVDDLKQNLESEKQKSLQERPNQIYSISKNSTLLPQSSINSSPTTIRKMIQSSNDLNSSSNSSDLVINTLKRSLKYDDCLSTNQPQFKQPHFDQDCKEETKSLHENSDFVNSYLSSSSSTLIKSELINNSYDVELEKNADSYTKMNSFISEIPYKDSLASNSNDNLSNPNLIFVNTDNTNININQIDDTINNSTSINNLSGLDDLILNDEDEFAVQNCLDF